MVEPDILFKDARDPIAFGRSFVHSEAFKAMFREDVAWRPVALTVVVVIALACCGDAPIPWPRHRSRSER